MSAVAGRDLAPCGNPRRLGTRADWANDYVEFRVAGIPDSSAASGRAPQNPVGSPGAAASRTGQTTHSRLSRSQLPRKKPGFRPAFLATSCS
jgi:hypothetical protein